MSFSILNPIISPSCSKNGNFLRSILATLTANFYLFFFPDLSSTIILGSICFHSNSWGIYLHNSICSFSFNPNAFLQFCFNVCKFKIFSSFSISTFCSIYCEYDLISTFLLQMSRTSVRSSTRFSGSFNNCITIC